MNIAILPARGGSKRIKNKNILKISGRPMIEWTIKKLINSKLFKHIIVSSDSKKIQNIAKRAGGEILFTRPKKLSDDKTGTYEVINHALEFLEKKKKIYPKYICCVYPTSIMINHKNLALGLKKIKSKKFEFSFSATDYGHPPQRGFYLKNNIPILLNKKNYKSRTQDQKKIFHDAGQFYWGKPLSWKKYKLMFSKKSFGIKIARHLALDIDDKEDIKLLKIVFKSQLKKNNL